MCALRTLISDGLAIVPVARANSQLSPYILGQCSQELTGQLLLSPENNYEIGAWLKLFFLSGHTKIVWVILLPLYAMKRRTNTSAQS